VFQQGILRILSATAGLAVFAGCGTYHVGVDDDHVAESMRRGRVVHVVGEAGTASIRVQASPPRASDPLFQYLSMTHGLSAAGFTDREIADVSDYLREFGSQDGTVVLAPGVEDHSAHPGFETFNVSCALCHNSPNVVGPVSGAFGAVDEIPPAVRKVGP
jgi:hypothetical protein